LTKEVLARSWTDERILCNVDSGVVRGGQGGKCPRAPRVGGAKMSITIIN